MNLLLRTNSNDEHNNESYDFAVVILDERAAKILAGYLNLYTITKKSQPGLVELTFTGDEAVCNFYNGNLVWDSNGDIEGLTDDEMDQFNDVGWLKLPDTFKLPDPEKAFTPEAMFVNIGKDRIYWEALPVDSSVTIHTDSPDVSILAQLI